MKIIAVLAACLVMGGCQGLINKGGSGLVTYSESLKTADQEKTTEVTATVNQPNNPEKAAITTISKDDSGTVTITTTTGSSQNVAESVSKINLLSSVIYAGIALILLGVVLFFITKNIYWSGITAGVGISMIVGSYLLAQYALYILFGVAIIVPVGIYLLYRNFVYDKATKENVDLIDQLKERIPGLKDTIKDVAEKIQSNTTKKIVRKKRNKA